MEKKAELSINMIVVIVIALLVLILIVYVLFNTGSGFNTSTSCGARGGVCVESNQCPGASEIGQGLCSDEQSQGNTFCCPIQSVRR